ncbi:recombinase family protein [Streptomyces sp. NPDC001373]|uniref:recombinase family protein n=1 Tax=Streptomyces sp. NPDC001373 TaxID=3364565 RepID=UPI00369AB4EE
MGIATDPAKLCDLYLRRTLQDNKDTLKAHERDLRDRAQREGLTVREVWTDEASAFKAGVTREKFDKAIAAVVVGEVRHLLVWELDRLSRRGMRQVGDVLDTFEPSPRWSQGSGLTIGAMWLWQDFDHLAFDFAEGMRPTEDFRSDEQFTAVADALALEAAQHVQDIRSRFSGLDKVTECLLQRPDRSGYLWENFNAGVAAALMGQPEAARQRLQKVLDEDPMSEWIREAQQTARDVSAMAHDTLAVQEWAQTRVSSC